jgi:hypothetical protein
MESASARRRAAAPEYHRFLSAAPKRGNAALLLIAAPVRAKMWMPPTRVPREKSRFFATERASAIKALKGRL